MAIRAVINIAAMSLYGSLQRRTGTVRLYQIAMAMWPASVLFFPYLNYLARQGESRLLFNAMVLLYFAVWSFAGLTWSKLFDSYHLWSLTGVTTQRGTEF